MQSVSLHQSAQRTHYYPQSPTVKSFSTTSPAPPHRPSCLHTYTFHHFLFVGVSRKRREPCEGAGGVPGEWSSREKGIPYPVGKCSPAARFITSYKIAHDKLTEETARIALPAVVHPEIVPSFHHAARHSIRSSGRSKGSTLAIRMQPRCRKARTIPAVDCAGKRFGERTAGRRASREAVEAEELEKGESERERFERVEDCREKREVIGVASLLGFIFLEV